MSSVTAVSGSCLAALTVPANRVPPRVVATGGERVSPARKGRIDMIHRTIRRGVLALAVAIAALFATVPLQAAGGNSYTVTPLVSDVPGAAPVIDPNLVNAWGLTASSTQPVSGSRTTGPSVSTLYNGAGVKQGLVVTVRPDERPTGNCLHAHRHRCSTSDRRRSSGSAIGSCSRPRSGTIARLATVRSTRRPRPFEASAIRAPVYKGLAIAGRPALRDATSTNGQVDGLRQLVFTGASPGALHRSELAARTTRRSASRRSAARLRHLREAGRRATTRKPHGAGLRVRGRVRHGRQPRSRAWSPARRS